MKDCRIVGLPLAVAFVAVSGAFAEIPPGYYDPAAGLSGEPLKAALHEIIDDHTSITYTEIWVAFWYTDQRPDGYVWDMYSDIPGGTPPYLYTFFEDQGTGGAGGEGEGYDREHSFPKSWFGGEVMPMYTDLFHIVPADVYVNLRRSNYPYGEVANPTWTSMNGSRLGPCSWPGYSGTVFEPRDDFKGDFARNYFYMATRYYTEDASWPGSPMVDGSQPLPWAECLLVNWHVGDPVSDKEIERNDAVYGYQGNRNPFIDHPEWVLLIWSPTAGTEGGEPGAWTPSLEASPNPFSAITTIEFTLMEPEEVDLAIYDLSGRLVRAVMDGAPLAAGVHEVSWDGAGASGVPLPSGVYFCRLSVPGAASSCEVLLVR
jgi:endonuclease I